MKKIIFSLLLITPFMGAMDTPSLDGEKSVAEIDAEFDATKFAKGEFPWSLLITTPLGREHLLLTRIAEKLAFCCVYNLNSDMCYIASSLVYGNRGPVGVFINKTNSMRIGGGLSMHILTEAIADIEWVVEEHCHEMLSSNKRLYEETRINDLILLAEILKNDNANDEQRIQPYELPERLEYTHKRWPPEDNKIFSSLSGYTVIKKALEVRRARADALYSAETKEIWSHSILSSKGKVAMNDSAKN